MEILKDILYKTRIIEVSGKTDIRIKGVCIDSRKVKPQTLFIAIKGIDADGHKYIDQAIKKGAIAIVCGEMPTNKKDDITYILASDTREAVGYIAANFYDNPSKKLNLIGVTGTNGKTSIVTMLYHLFEKYGKKSGLISTIKCMVADVEYPTTNTTPDAISLNKLLSEMIDKGCQYCFMEVSSHAVDQKRIGGLVFRGGIFTNITHDHLDYHKTFKDYLSAKKTFFDCLSEDSFSLINKDDKNGRVMIQNTKSKPYFYSLKSSADFMAKIIEMQLTGMEIRLNGIEVWVKLTGEFNAYNILAVYACSVILCEDPMVVLTILSELNAVEGRFESVQSSAKITGIVDYAHTPDALLNILKSIGKLKTGTERLITVVGCGGNRDKTKRPIMAKIASEFSDKVILTSDNPRFEDPEAIIQEMQQGVSMAYKKKVLVITNRKDAIQAAVSIAEAGDIILVAGKGHEKYQDICGIKHLFDDKEILLESLKTLSV